MRNFLLSLALFFAFVGQPLSVAAHEIVSPIRSNTCESKRPPQTQKSESRKRSSAKRKRSQPAVPDSVAGAPLQAALPPKTVDPTRIDSVGSERSRVMPHDSLVVEEECVEMMPTFRRGGVDKFRKWLIKTVVYPEELLRNRMEGAVTVSFVIERNGKIGRIRAVDFSHAILLRAVVEALEKAPRWTPGTIDGEPVAVQFTLPIQFLLSEYSLPGEGETVLKSLRPTQLRPQPLRRR